MPGMGYHWSPCSSGKGTGAGIIVLVIILAVLAKAAHGAGHVVQGVMHGIDVLLTVLAWTAGSVFVLGLVSLVTWCVVRRRAVEATAVSAEVIPINRAEVPVSLPAETTEIQQIHRQVQQALPAPSQTLIINVYGDVPDSKINEVLAAVKRGRE